MPNTPTLPLTVRTSMPGTAQPTSGSPLGTRTPPASPRAVAAASEDTFEEMSDKVAGGSQPSTPRKPTAGLVPPGSPAAPATKAVAPRTPEVAALTRSLAAETAQIRATLGWGAHGIAKGLKMGTLIGVGLGLFSALCSNPQAGIAFMVLGVALGFIVGAVAQYRAYGRVPKKVQGELEASISRLEATENQAIPSVELQDARKLLVRLKAGWMGGIGAALTGKGTPMTQKLLGLKPAAQEPVTSAEDRSEKTVEMPSAPAADSSEETVEAPVPKLGRSGSNVSRESVRSIIDEDPLIELASNSEKGQPMSLAEQLESEKLQAHKDQAVRRQFELE